MYERALGGCPKGTRKAVFVSSRNAYAKVVFGEDRQQYNLPIEYGYTKFNNDFRKGNLVVLEYLGLVNGQPVWTLVEQDGEVCTDQN